MKKLFYSRRADLALTPVIFAALVVSRVLLLAAAPAYPALRSDLAKTEALAQAPRGEGKPGPVIRIAGTAELQEYNPRTGTPYPQQHTHSAFAVTLAGTAWRLCVTNLEWPSWWAQVTYDGTNCYTLLPFRGALFAPYAGIVRASPPAGMQVATVEPCDRATQATIDNTGFYALWLTYGLCSATAKTNAAGLVEIPFSGARVNPGCFGYNWRIRFSQGGRFATELTAVRDQKLDLADDQELLRPELDYPDTLAEYGNYRELLASRKAAPDGFVKAKYSVTQWRRAGGMAVPAAARYEVYSSPSFTSWPWRVVEIKAPTFVTVASADTGAIRSPQITASTEVRDYRYKMANDTRIFKYATYTLRPGDAWKPGDDPTLLAQASEWLRNGRRYSDFASDEGSHARAILKGQLLPALSALGLAPADYPVGRPLLAVLIDCEQRPSRRAVAVLMEQSAALKRKGVAVVVLQAAKVDDEAFAAWKREAASPFPVGRFGGDPETARVAWGAPALPWLILTDGEHRVVAEGIPADEIGARLDALLGTDPKDATKAGVKPPSP
jgi:hypothetical protein